MIQAAFNGIVGDKRLPVRLLVRLLSSFYACYLTTMIILEVGFLFLADSMSSMLEVIYLYNTLITHAGNYLREKQWLSSCPLTERGSADTSSLLKRSWGEI